jgi:cytochrome P450
MSAAAGDVFPYPAGPGGTVPPQYGRLLAEDPVSRVRLADGGELYLVTRDSDVRTVLTDPVFSRYAAAVLPGKGFGRGQGTGIVDLDPPQHTVLRSPIVSAFGPGRVARWRPRIEAIAGELLSGLGDEPGPVDLVSSYTAPFAGRVVVELLGFEGARWQRVTGDVETLLTSGGAESPEADACRDRLGDAFTTLLKERDREPGDDVATVLLGHDDPEAGGGALTEAQRVTLLHGLVISGYIGIRDLLARHLYGVLTTPGFRDRLVAQPELVPGAVVELLRFYPSSNDGLLRLATRDVERPDQLLVDRARTPTLAFGAGPHQCPAADLATVQLATGIGRLLAAYPGARLAVPAEDVEHTSRLLPLGVTELPVLLRAPA